MEQTPWRVPRAIGGWDLWRLPRKARALVIAVDGLFVLAAVVGIATTRFVAADLVTAAMLLAGGMLSVEGSLRLIWRRPKDASTANDMLAVWTLPVALLLPPVYSVAVIVPLQAFLQLRAMPRPPVRWIFTMATVGLAGYVASAAHIALAGSHASWDVAALVGTAPAMGVTVFCAMLRHFVNASLVGEVVALTKPGARWSDHFHDKEAWAVVAAEGCTGVLVAIACAASPYAILLAIPPVLVLQRTLLVAEFREAARTDPKTGLANSSYWREVADRELARARGSGQPLAVLLIDVDHFKSVNDRFGHLVGDEVLRGVANSLTHGLRPRDFVGRFGGEEFVVLLAGSDVEQARHTAERIRSQVADAAMEASNRRAEVRVTVSVGVAAFRESGHSIHELLDAADTALYAAKHAGRNCVRVAHCARQQVLDLTGDIPRVVDVSTRTAPTE